MRPHRTIWYITGCAVVAACIVLFVRNVGAPDGAAPPDIEARVERMLELLDGDPEVRRAATREIVESLAALAQQGEVTSSATYYALALRRHRGEGDLDAAETAYRKAVELDPEWALPHNGLGRVLYALDRWEESEAALRRAIALDPESSHAHNLLAVLLRRTERFDDALREAERALEIAPDDVAANNNYGNLLLTLGRLADAEERYRKAILIAPDYPKPYYNLACVHSRLGRKDDAIELLEKAVALDSAFRAEASGDPDFDLLRDDPRFQAIVAPPPAQ